MTTLLYSPGIEVHISTAGHGIIDVTDDLSSGSLTLAENSLGSFRFTLNNHRRKYDGLFTPNDRVVVKMKRIKWLQVFSGYMDEVPFFSVFPRKIELSASCTLKRLMYHPWDPGSIAAYNLLSSTGTGGAGASQVDGGMREKIVALLTEVGGWPKAQIHMGQIPANWLDKVTNLSSEVAAATAQADSAGPSPVFGGSASTSAGSLAPPTGSPNSMCALPASSGKCSAFGGPADTGISSTGTMYLTGESGRHPRDPWYCAMRWGYMAMDAAGVHHHPVGTLTDRNKAINWLRNRKLIVTNRKDGRAVVVRAADWGPGGIASANARVIDLSPQTLKALGLDTDSIVDIRWAPSQNTPLGPTTTQKLGATAQFPGLSPQAAKNAAKVIDSDTSGTATTASVKISTQLPFTKESQGGGYNMPHVHAAKVFIQQNWPWVPEIGGYAPGTGHIGNSEHYTGHALDVMMGAGGKMPSAALQAKGNSIALWFAQNPDAFGITQIIWRAHIITRARAHEGWRPYSGPPGGDRLSLDHWNHIHLSFDHDDSRTSVGPMSNGWCTGQEAFFTSVGVTTPNGQGYIPSGGVGGAADTGNLLNTFNWYGSPDPESMTLTGPRALMNDTALLDTVSSLCQTSMRSYMAAPNGDFIAWFPDYFDNYKIAGKLHLADVELMGDGFTIQWNDQRLITHQFVAGAPTGFSEGSAPGEAVDIYQKYTTQGIVSIEIPEVMQALFNLDPKSERGKQFLNAAGVLNRYGARPDFQAIGTITGPQAEFWMALSLFQRNWASQFSSNIETTFMPEAWPGMLAVIDSYQFQAYITQVTHSFNFEGGGFATSISVIAPSSMGSGGLYGLPHGGGTAVKKPAVKPKAPVHK